MNFESGIDASGNSWFAVERGIDVSLVGVAVPVENWPVDLAAQQPLLSQIWALQATRILSASNLRHAVNPVFSHDFVGISVQLDHQVAKIVPGVISLLAESAWVMPSALIAKARTKAVDQLHAHSQDIEALRRFVPSWHRYGTTLQRRLEVLQEDTLDELTTRMALSPKLIVAVDSGELVPEISEVPPRREARIIEPPENKGPEYYVNSLSVEQQVRVSAFLPGVSLASSAKYDLHVAWLLLRSREGILYKNLRKYGPIAYKVAAFSREYAAAGYGAMSVSCDKGKISRVRRVFEETLAEMHAGLSTSEITWAVQELELQHGLAMRDPIRLARATLSHMIVGSSVAEYPSGIASVTPESLSAAMEMGLRPSA